MPRDIRYDAVVYSATGSRPMITAILNNESRPNGVEEPHGDVTLQYVVSIIGAIAIYLVFVFVFVSSYFLVSGAVR